MSTKEGARARILVLTKPRYSTMKTGMRRGTIHRGGDPMGVPRAPVRARP